MVSTEVETDSECVVWMCVFQCVVCNGCVACAVMLYVSLSCFCVCVCDTVFTFVLHSLCDLCVMCCLMVWECMFACLCKMG